MDPVVDSSHRLQAAALIKRWLARVPFRPPGPAVVPERAELPPEAVRHYRHFAWVVHEQRILGLTLGFLLAACALVWTAAIRLQGKPAVVVRAGPSLREAADAFYGQPEIAYDQLAFFLQGCLPLLYAADENGQPLLPLAEGLVAPEICREAERRFAAGRAEILARHVTQTLILTGVSKVTADPATGRAGAYVRGTVAIMVRGGEARFYPWRGQVILAVNPGGRLNPFPFYLLALDTKTGGEALAWDKEKT